MNTVRFRFPEDDEKSSSAKVSVGSKKASNSRKGRKKAGVVAVALSGALVTGLLSAVFIPAPQKAEASVTLPKIETLKAALSSGQDSLRILEIVDNKESATFGYYFEGQEPVDFENDILGTAQKKEGQTLRAARQEAADNYFFGLASKGILGGDSSTVMMFTETFKEYYPWEKLPDNVREQDINKETVSVTGSYTFVGRTGGDFLPDGSSYKILTDSSGKAAGTYTQDIYGNRAAFSLVDDSVTMENKGDFVFYTPKMVPFYVKPDETSALFFLDDEETQPLDVSGLTGKFIFTSPDEPDGDITKYEYYGTFGETNHWEYQYSKDENNKIKRKPYYYMDSLTNGEELPIIGSSDNDALSESVLSSMIESKAWYSLPASLFFTNESQDPYDKFFDFVPSSFRYVGDGEGSFDIKVKKVEGDPAYNDAHKNDRLPVEADFSVIYDKSFFSYEVKNNNLFLKYVLDFDLDTSDEVLREAAANVTVDSVVYTDVSSEQNEAAGQSFPASAYDMIVMQPGAYVYGEGVKEVPEVFRNVLKNAAINGTAILFDVDRGHYGVDKNWLMTQFISYNFNRKYYSKEEPADSYDRTTKAKKTFDDRDNFAPDPGFDHGYVDGNILFYDLKDLSGGMFLTNSVKDSVGNDDLYFRRSGAAFEGVYKEIVYENFLRQRNGSTEMIKTDGFTFGNILRYVLNYKNGHREQTKKTSISILEIEPDNHSELLENDTNAYPNGVTGKANSTVLSWFGNTYTKDQITIATMSTYEFIGKINDVTEDYDLVYIGSDVMDFNKEAVTTKFSGFNDFGWCHWQGVKADGKESGRRVECVSGSWFSGKKNGCDNKYLHWVERGDTIVFQDDYKYFRLNDVVRPSDKPEDIYDAVFYEIFYGTRYNDTVMNGLIYYNIGDTIKTTKYRGLGLFKEEVDFLNNYSNGHTTDGYLDLNDLNNYRFTYRFSGNDLTNKKVDELLAFAEGGFPVVVANDLLQSNTSGYTVNSGRVDVNSKIYGLLDSIKERENVFSSRKASENTGSVMRYVSLSKPSLNLSRRPVEYNETSHESVGSELSYTFTISNDTDPTPDSTTYSVSLYIDQNGDGLYSESESISDLQVRRAGRAIATDKLLANVSYDLSRELPSDLKGVLPWKLEVTKNSSSAGLRRVHASENGWSYARPDQPISIKILQIADKANPDNNNLMKQAANKKSQYWNLLQKISDMYSLTFTTKSSTDMNAYYSTAADQRSDDDERNIKKYDMLIIGFYDCFSEINNLTAEAILEFADDGRAVLFSHDTTSFISYDWLNSSFGSAVYKNGKNELKDVIDKGGSYPTLGGGNLWGYNFNKYLRSTLGLDRYGISDEKVHNENGTEFKLGGPMSEANGWREGLLYQKNTNMSELLQSAIEAAGYDLAKQPGGYKGQLVPETQGTTDYYLSVNNASVIKNDKVQTYRQKFNNGYLDKNQITTTVTQENEGQITKYPFSIESTSVGGVGDDGYGRRTLKVGNTHYQYFQLNMNYDDIIVWYCLGQNEGTAPSIYNIVPNDVVNSYYIYSFKNVTYTGAGHSSISSVESEAKLFVNTIVAAYRAATGVPEFKFVPSLSSDDDATPISGICLPSERVVGAHATNGQDEVYSDQDKLSGRVNFQISDNNLAEGKKLELRDLKLTWDGIKAAQIPDPYSHTEEEALQAKKEHPNALLLVHPECKSEVTHLADYVGSTTEIIDFAKKSNEKEFIIIGTENSILEQLEYECPDKSFYMLLPVMINTPEALKNPLTVEISKDGTVSFKYFDNDLKVKTSTEKVRIFDSNGVDVINGESPAKGGFTSGKTYCIDVEKLSLIYEKLAAEANTFARQHGHGAESFVVPPEIPSEFDIEVLPVTIVGGKENKGDKATLHITTAGMFDIG